MSEQDTRKTINEIRASFGAPPTTMTDEQIEAGREVYGAKLDYDMAVFDEVQDTREQLNEELMDSCLTFADHGGHLRAFSYVSELLDRQAEITKNECREEHRKRLGELHGLLDEAAREREELAWRVEYNGELVEKVKLERNNLQYENDALKERISQSAAHETAETAENSASKSEIRNFDDSREQLEADVANILRNAASHTSANTSIGDMLRYTVPGSGAAPWQLEEDACEALASIAERQIAELTEERDNWAECYDMAVKREQNLLSKMDELTAEVEKQRQRANDAERGALSDEWYVARDRYKDDVAELTAERDQLSRDLEAEHALLCQFEDDNERMREALKAFELNQMYSLYKQACMDRDEWRSKYEALRYNKEKVWCDCDCCNWRDERERLTDEVESLKRANRIQAESFKKLELQAGKDG